MPQELPSDKLSPIIKLQHRNREFYVKNMPAFSHYFENYNKGILEPFTFEIFDAFLKPDYSYIDIGAWIGITVLYGCQIAKHCFALEPFPIDARYLIENVKLNRSLIPKITLSTDCLYDRNGMMVLGNKYRTQTLPLTSQQTDSLPTWIAPAITLADFMKDYQITDCNFIKIDLEGMEGLIVPSMLNALVKDFPTLLLSMHPPYFKDQPRALRGIINVLNFYEHLFTADGIEISPLILTNSSLQETYYDLVATNVPLEDILNTDWGKRIKLLN